ncbi:MAG: LacI family DNA-binding transcriptional regulator [Eubacteriales bacterium]|nr:LacI family DNA-binding transcriptional regulator [Eubacteriales bacterium]
MSNRPTIKDIARKAKVSTGTVHLALNHKKGVSDETGERVRRIALEIGYQPNAVAAGLKRKRSTIAVVLPVRESMNRFYFAYQWNGIRDYIDSMRDFNIEMLSVPYYDAQLIPADVLDTILDEQKPNGIICTGFVNARGAAALKRYSDSGIPVVLLGADVPETGRLCSVMVPYEIIGAMLAEQLVAQTRGQKGKFFIGTGSAEIASHYLVVEGFRRYMESQGLNRNVVSIATEAFCKDREAGFLKVFREENCIGCCAVSARDSVALAEALIDSGMAGKIPAIGSDVFPENVEYMRKGVFSNLIQKNPYQQAFVAAQYLTEYLVQGKRPSKEVINIGGEMVFQSNLPLYDNGFYRLLL